jgi:hypothetical protein
VDFRLSRRIPIRQRNTTEVRDSAGSSPVGGIVKERKKDE